MKKERTDKGLMKACKASQDGTLLKKFNKESDIQRRIYKYLKLKGYFFTRINTVGLFDEKLGVRRKNPYVARGCPDILVFVPKKGIYGLEVKREGAYQSKEQKFFE